MFPCFITGAQAMIIEVEDRYCKEGKQFHRLPERRLRPYVSAFGPTPFWRDVYAERETQRQEVVPLDAKLGMPEGNTAELCQKWSGTKCVKESDPETRP